MTLRDNLQKGHFTKWEVEKTEEKISFYLDDDHAWIEVKCHHDKFLKFMTKLIDVAWTMADETDCSKMEKMMLLMKRLDDLGNLKDKWFPEKNDD